MAKAVSQNNFIMDPMQRGLFQQSIGPLEQQVWYKIPLSQERDHHLHQTAKTDLARFNKLASQGKHPHAETMSPSIQSPRLAARAIIIHNDRLLLVNAYPKHHLGLWCAPGGGVERGSSIPDNLIREVFEETGLTITVGELALINEFHDPKSGFHQVDLIFRCTLVKGQIDPDWKDIAGVVSKRKWASAAEMTRLVVKPSTLSDVAFAKAGANAALYDPLEVILN
jgi:8-oxo-dGTP diphosphatase